MKWQSSTETKPEFDVIQCGADLCFAKIPSACVFIAFQLARIGQSRRLLTVKISRRLFNFSAGWSFGEAQLRALLDMTNNVCVVIALRHLSLTMFYILVFTSPLVISLLSAVF